MGRGLTAAALLCALVLAALFPPAPAFAVAAPPSPEEEAVLKELFTLGRSLEEIRGALAGVARQVADVTGRREAAAAERDRLEARRRERQAQFNLRLRYYQERGRVAPLAVLLGSTSFIDFLSRLDLLNQVLENDAALIAELRSLKAAVAAQEQALQAAEAELAQLQAKLAAEEARLQAEIARREAVLAGLQEQRAAMEARLAGVERTWKEKGEPVLLALGSTLQRVDPSTFEPDQISVSFFPPGATALITADSLTRFFRQVPELKELTFRLEAGTVSLEGQFDGERVKVGGQFSVAGKTALRFEAKQIEIGDFTVPPDSIAALLQGATLDFDLTELINPWALKSVDVNNGELRIRAGIR